MGELRVNEIFKSIQGESTRAGMPCVFVRLAGCNLRCRYCDTAYAYYEGEATTVGAVVQRCREHGGSLVELTGGEPLHQAGSRELACCLVDAGWTVLVETNGSVPIDGLPVSVVRIVDLKCPGSGESDRILWSNVDLLTDRDEVKFVIADRRDYEWAREALVSCDLAGRCGAVLFAPVYQVIAPRTLAHWILEDGLDVRLQLQLHKYIWPSEERGV